MLTYYICTSEGEIYGLYKVQTESCLMLNTVRRLTTGRVKPTAQTGFCRIDNIIGGLDGRNY